MVGSLLTWEVLKGPFREGVRRRSRAHSGNTGLPTLGQVLVWPGVGLPAVERREENALIVATLRLAGAVGSQFSWAFSFPRVLSEDTDPFCPRLSLRGYLFGQQPWKMQVVSAWQTDLLVVPGNRDDVSLLEAKVRQGCGQPPVTTGHFTC